MRLATLLFTLALLGGCALSPQTVVIAPSIPPAATAGSGGPALALQAEDARANAAIGIRGGVYKTSEIRAGNDIGEAVRASAAAALAAQGYTLAADSDTRLTLYVDELSYQTNGGTVSTGADITAVLRAVAQRGNARYETTYRSTLSRKFPVAPSATQNEAWLNEVLGESLQRFLDDGKMRTFLAGG